MVSARNIFERQEHQHGTLCYFYSQTCGVLTVQGPRQCKESIDLSTQREYVTGSSFHQADWPLRWASPCQVPLSNIGSWFVESLQSLPFVWTSSKKLKHVFLSSAMPSTSQCRRRAICCVGQAFCARDRGGLARPRWVKLAISIESQRKRERERE